MKIFTIFRQENRNALYVVIKQLHFRQQQEREAQEAEKRAKEAENLAAKEAADLAAKEAAEAEELAKKKKEEEVRMMFPNDHCPTFFIYTLK